MEKILNTTRFDDVMAAKGLSQTALAESLGVTRAAVSKWLTGKSFPRPAELLKLGRLLGLGHKELVLSRAPQHEPLVAFRKRGSCHTTDAHVQRARDMGRLLKPLVPFLAVDEFIGPPTLKNPSCDYRYIQDLAARIRRDLDIAENAAFEFGALIALFEKHQAVIVPTLWGPKTKHENAIHIHLPDSQTTWIYLNLDVEIRDFKFWMAHELGHVLTVDLLREEKIELAEDFADAFAGALLFPESVAKFAYAEYKKARSVQGQLRVLFTWAEQHMISPNSVYKEIEKFAAHHREPFTKIPASTLHSAIAQKHKHEELVSTRLFDGKLPTADHFMRVVQDAFRTQAYSALSRYVREKKPSAGTVATILGINRMDASAYLEAFAQ
jgi:transcriptional regulator with XRE-family HTH domain